MDRIQSIRESVIKEKQGDPLQIDASWQLIEDYIPEKYWQYLITRDGAYRFVEELPKEFPPNEFIDKNQVMDAWIRIGNFYRNMGHFHEGLAIYNSLYEHICLAQDLGKRQKHKGELLVWMSDCCMGLNWIVLRKRYLMLTLCEDAILHKGKVPADTSGIYFRLVWFGGLSDLDFKRYAEEMYELFKKNTSESYYPEWIIQNLSDNDWMLEYPSGLEASVYIANKVYISKLVRNLGDKSGKTLELLSEYILSCMTGCKTYRRHFSPSTDYDIVCSIDGLDLDFRSELGRYFVCECKDWSEPANFTTMAKFCRVLDSTKSRFGILFSKKGISGDGQTTNAEREQLKVFQDRGMVIVVVDENDIKEIAQGSNFIAMLRRKYEKVRLDLRK